MIKFLLQQSEVILYNAPAGIFVTIETSTFWKLNGQLPFSHERVLPSLAPSLQKQGGNEFM
jgi:hypothetical protein